MKFKPVAYLGIFIVVPALFCLGLWQLDRAEQKRKVMEDASIASNQEIINLDGGIKSANDAILYRNATATGSFDIAHQFLLDNQIHKGKAGFAVLTPFLLNGSSEAVLVNRGWVPLGRTRAELPDLNFTSSVKTIHGRISKFPSVGMALEGGDVPTKQWPSIIQQVKSDKISSHLGYFVMPYQLELDPSEANGYVREWRSPVNMPPEKHVAYAVQWFILAATLVIIILKYGRQTANV